MPDFFGVFQYVVLQVGQILGVPGLRGNHFLPHCRHLCSLITSMYLALRISTRKVVALMQLKKQKGDAAPRCQPSEHSMLMVNHRIPTACNTRRGTQAQRPLRQAVYPRQTRPTPRRPSSKPCPVPSRRSTSANWTGSGSGRAEELLSRRDR